MKKFNYIVRMMLVLVVTFMTFSGADRNWEKERKDWEKNHKTSTQKDVDKANRKANIAIGVAAVATIIALTK